MAPTALNPSGTSIWEWHRQRKLEPRATAGGFVKKFIFAALAVLGLLIQPAVAVSAAGTGFSVDPSQKAVASLKPCKTVEDLDCIHGLYMQAADGNFEAVKFLNYSDRGIDTDANGNKISRGEANYEFASVNAELETPNHVIFENHLGGAMRLYINPDQSHKNSHFKIVVRTSWLKPQDIQMKVLEADYLMKPYREGTLWTFSGRQATQSGYNGDWNAKMAAGAKADNTMQSFQIFVHHSDPKGSYFDTRCDAAGFTVESHNAPGAGKPMWNYKTKSLDFNIQAPHLDVKGKLNVGFFKFWASDSYMDCAWPGNDLVKASEIVVSIVYENGDTQVATSFVKHNNGQMLVSVSDLHFSSPTIKLTAATNIKTPVKDGASSATPSPTPSVTAPVVPVAKKKTTITCVSNKNKKLTKLVTAVAPKCPVGYKKR